MHDFPSEDVQSRDVTRPGVGLDQDTKAAEDYLRPDLLLTQIYRCFAFLSEPLLSLFATEIPNTVNQVGSAEFPFHVFFDVSYFCDVSVQLNVVYDALLFRYRVQILDKLRTTRIDFSRRIVRLERKRIRDGRAE